MRKKILFLVQLPPPVNGASIMNNHVVSNKSIQSRYECQVLELRFADSLEDIGKVSLKKIGLLISTFFKLINKLFFFRPQLVYFTIAPAGAAFYRDFLFAIMIKISGCKLLLHIHGKGFSEGAKKNKFYCYLCERIFKNSFCIHLSESLKNDVPFSHIKKRYVVPNGVPEVTGSSIKKYSANSITRLLYLSNYVKSKGILDLIDAIEKVTKQNNKLHLRLVGKPFDLTEEYLTNYINNKDLGVFVTVCGPKYNEDKYDELSKADIFIFPTYYTNEAFPLVLLEALGFGLPCISTNHGGIPDIIEDGMNGMLVDPQNPEALANQISFLLNNQELLNKMSKNARREFLEKYTLPIFEKNLLQVFDDILMTNK